jgi:NADPH-dependent glutamate synthase beta subunit-like oxidoreductase/NAD-dependent dihydropyrimidine dehydrogenase PreA subunit
MEEDVQMAVRPKILALANKITFEARTGIPNVPSDPEYRILAEVVTDDQADVAMACKVRQARTLEDIARRCGKSKEETKRLLLELSHEGVVINFAEPGQSEDSYYLPCWVPGIMEMMVGNKEQAEKHPEIPRCFEEYTRKNMQMMAPNLPTGMGVMRVIPVESAIKSENHVPTSDELHGYIDGAWKIAVTGCSCRRVRRIMGEGCGHLEEDMCIMLDRAADFQIKSGHGHEITKDEAYAILKRAEDNGLIHEVSNIDGTGKVSGICNCCECSCLSLRGGRMFNNTDLLKSNYHAEVDRDKCVACGQCVENCQMNALHLGQKLCSTEPLEIRKAEKPGDGAWGRDKWNVDWRENREDVAESGTAPCKTKCPAHIAVQGYIKLASQGKYRDALELIKKENPFPAICGRVCPRFCEDECTRGDIDAPIAIDEIKKFIAEQDMKAEHRFVPPMVNQTGKPFSEKIAVIGAGPAGLSCAYFLAVKGYPVTVFEKEKKPGGMMTLGIPEFRLEKKVVNSEIDVLKELGVEFKTGVEVGKDVTLAQLRSEGYKAFYLAIGASKGTPVGCPGDDLEGVYTGIDFLRNVNLGKKPEVGKAVAVIGGGNVSIDVARSAIRLGAEKVYLVYRRGRDEIKADSEEVEDAIAEGMEMKLLRAPAEITGKDGRAASIKLEIMELGEPDASGRRSPVATGKFETLKVDCVIGAIGQKVDMGGIEKGSMAFTKKGTVVADGLTYQTAQPDVFAGGDVVTGPKFVIDAIAAGKEGAVSIHRYVHEGQTLTLGRDRRNYRAIDKSTAAVGIGGYDDIPRQAPSSAEAAKARRTFRDLRGTFTEEQLKKETERCLGCGATVVDTDRCVGCGICTTKCKFDAIHLVSSGEFKSPRVENLAPYMIGNMVKRGGKIAIKAAKKTVSELTKKD